jgi:hypothetical protein
MTATVTKDTRKHFFVALLGFLAVFSLGNESWSYSQTQNQPCSGNCGGLERLDTSASSKSLDARPLSFTSADRLSDAQSMDLSSASDIRSTTPGSNLANTDQGATSAQAFKNPGTDGGSTPGPGFFLLVGLALIGVRMVISYRSRKLKNLATGTH